jgi:hypothetical protein
MIPKPQTAIFFTYIFFPRASLPKTAKMATQSGIGAELGASPGHGSETEALN